MRTFTNSGHATEESLELHALGDLPRPSEVRIDDHLSGCSGCRVRYMEILDFVAVLRATARAAGCAHALVKLSASLIGKEDPLDSKGKPPNVALRPTSPVGSAR